MINLILMFLISITGYSSQISGNANEEVDLIELNHFHDCLGRHVYDQVIFYEWNYALNEYHVRAWCLVEDRSEEDNRRPTRTYTDNRYHVRWHDRDQNLKRHITSVHYRESWTQIDPERANKKILDERLRTSLIKRIIDKKETIPQLEVIDESVTDSLNLEIPAEQNALQINR